MRKYTYLIIDNSDIYELPVACCDSVELCAHYLGISYGSAKNAICYKQKVHNRFTIEKVINTENS